MADHYALVAHAIAYLRANAARQPGLDEVAAAVHLSPTHLQRVFSEWAGISPKRFLQHLTKAALLQRLADTRDNLELADAVGLSSGSRVHDLVVSCEAMTPGELRSGAAGLAITCGFAASPFGAVLAAWTARGVCHFAFCTGPATAMLDELRGRWPLACLSRDDAAAQALLQRIFPATPEPGRVHLLLRGTNFQIKVWEALIGIAPGSVLSYRQLAGRIGAPRAQRAVGSALAANHIGLLIPCHRIIREGGEVGSYRWGSERKLALLAWEAARRP